MYKSGQVLFDSSIDEAVVFIKGEGEDYYVVCSGVKNNTAITPSNKIYPIWTTNNKVLQGRYATNNFATVLEVTKSSYKNFYKLINEVNSHISKDGREKGFRYHLKGYKIP